MAVLLDTDHLSVLESEDRPLGLIQRRTFMVARGRVQNGVVVLAEGVHLPEGQEVTVLAPSPAEPPAHSIMDIPPVNLGRVLRPWTVEDDLLAEMLEGRS